MEVWHYVRSICSNLLASLQMYNMVMWQGVSPRLFWKLVAFLVKSGVSINIPMLKPQVSKLGSRDKMQSPRNIVWKIVEEKLCATPSGLLYETMSSPFPSM